MGLGDKKTKIKKVDMMTKEQKKLRQKAIKSVDYEAFDIENNPLFKHGKQFLTEMMDPSSEAYKKYEAPYMQKFRETNAQTASRFGLGQNSSMAQGMNSQEQRLSENLASQRTQGMYGAAQQGLGYAQAPGQISGNLLNSALQAQPFGYQQIEPYEKAGSKVGKGIFKGLLVGGAALAGTALSGGNPMVGAAAGMGANAAIG